MNSIHDMGGMHGFGPVQPEANEPVFHARWEGRVFAVNAAMGAWRRFFGRYRLERLPPSDYLRLSYYERWLAAFVDLWVEAGLIAPEEVATGRPAAGSQRQTPPLTADKVPAALATGRSARRTTSTKPRFAAGDTVRARNMHPVGHTRLPRYVRGRSGRIERDHGAHVFADSNVLGQGENPQTLYTVRFAASELWGEAANPDDAVYLDLSEDYLEPV